MGDQPSMIPASGRALEDAERELVLTELGASVDQSQLFKSLDESGRQRLVESGYVVRYEPGDMLIRQGESDSRMFLVMEGTVRVETESATGMVELAQLSQGACVGEVSVLTGSVRTATVVAIDAVQCVAFERHRIERILADYPKVRERLSSLIEGRARDTDEKILGF